MAYTQPGTFSLFGWKTPDIGLSENLRIGAQNPDVLTYGAGLYQAPTSPVPQPEAGMMTGIGSPYVDPAAVAAMRQTVTENRGTTGQVQGATTTSTPQPSGGGGGGDSELAQLLKIVTETGGDPTQRGRLAYLLGLQQEQQMQATPSQEDIDAVFNPMFGTLNQQESQLRADQPGEEKRIEDLVTAGVGKVRGQEQEAQVGLARQEGDVREGETNAYQQARNLYNELAQRYGALFGSRSSAGPFAMELLGREAQKQFGQTQQVAQKGMQSIADEKNRLGTWVKTQLNEWDQKKTSALTELRKVFTNAISQINSQRGALESQKAQARYQTLIDVRNRQQAIEDADRSFRQQLTLFQAQKGGDLGVSPESYSVGTPGTQAAQALNQPVAFSTVGSQQSGGAGLSFAPTGGQGTRSGDYVFNGTTWVYSPRNA